LELYLKMNDVIRALTIADELIVWEMLQYASHESSLASVRNQPCLARYAAGWGRAGDMGCVAEINGVSVGATWLRLWTEDEKGFGSVSAEIPELAMAVLPEYRARGIGTRLLKEVLVMAMGHYPGISLSVRVDNVAVKLYEQAGFIKVEGSEVINRTGGVSFSMVRKFE
jgi:ribosomal protein S18 acetylase RimI-like enzyme